MRARSFRLAGVLATWVAMLRAAPAAQPATVVAVSAPPCIGLPYDRSRLVELLHVELGALGVSDVLIADPPASAVGPERLLATVVLTPAACVPTADGVTIEIVDRASMKKVERRMTFADMDAESRPRALAIAVAELLQASAAELELGGQPGAIAPPVALRTAVARRLGLVADAARASAAADSRALLEARDRAEAEVARKEEALERAPRLLLSAVAASYPGRGTALLGPEATFRLRFGEHGYVSVGAAGALGGTQVSAGSIAVRAVTAGLSVGYTTGGRVELAVGPRLDAGYGWATGTPGGASTRGSTYGGGLALASLSATLIVHTHAAVAPHLGLDVGQTLADVSFLADQTKAAGMAGVIVAARVGIGFGM